MVSVGSGDWLGVLFPASTETRMAPVMPQHQNADASSALAKKQMKRKARKIRAAQVSCGIMELPWFGRDLRDHGLQLCEKPVGKCDTSLLLVVLQDRSYVFLNEPVKNQRHPLAA